MPTTTIRKSLIESFGDPSHVSIVTTEIGPPAANEVQLKVLYSGFGGSDIAMRLGSYPNQKSAPLTTGYSCIGLVTLNGSKSTKFPISSLVGCLSVYEGQSERVNLPEKYLIPIPEGVDLKQAVALILDWTTAYGMVYRTSKVTKGQRVFIHGLSGSVGFSLLTLCKLQGAEVYGTASEYNHAAVRAAGAHPFVYTNKDWMMAMNAIGGAHVVFDPLGFESYDESWDILARGGGMLVGYGGNYNVLNGGKTRSQWPQIAKLLSKNLNVFCPNSTAFFYVNRDQSTFEPELKALLEMLRKGEIRVPIRKLWTLEEVPEAHRMFNKGPGVGAVVIKVANNVNL
ncbi:GroES-like protein [Macroventuria anomochaeta]|uniref:GroES-like protein n=1 Tax=Macroventuria anomochaeta TaxID=301207 RepID=A0ACB6S9P3_9PLEO|nr:GroES-like protein [Macroventuria anomochaeta]KAF2631005.1 GroES-like protein [Macroventuria anomochaeta]